MPQITVDPRVRWGTPCLRDTGVTVAHVVVLHKAGCSFDEILDACPELTEADVVAALDWHAERGDAGLAPRPPDTTDHPRISVSLDIQGGYPVIAGTRITVDAVLAMWEEGFAVDEILDEYPGLTAADVEAAVAYDAGVGIER